MDMINVGGGQDLKIVILWEWGFKASKNQWGTCPPISSQIEVEWLEAHSFRSYRGTSPPMDMQGAPRLQ